MTDTFGEWWEQEAETQQEATPAADLPMLPDGKHVGKIVVAEVKDLGFKVSERNPTGKSLVVKVAVHGYRLAEDIVPVQMRGIIEGICRSAGIHAPEKGEAFPAFCERLKGQTAPIETTQAAAASGREYVRVKWLAGTKPLPKEIEKRTTPRPKPAAAVDLAPDDIPF